jgi:hypothetical protein
MGLGGRTPGTVIVSGDFLSRRIWKEFDFSYTVILSKLDETRRDFQLPYEKHFDVIEKTHTQ